MSTSHQIIQTLNAIRHVPEERYADPYFSQLASMAVANRYYRIALICGLVVIISLVGIGVRLAWAIQHIEPLVVRVDPNGQATVTTYASLEYQLGEAELQYFLEHFTQDYFGRVRATILEANPRATCFLNRPMAEARRSEERVSRSIGKFLTSTDGDIEINVTAVAIKDTRPKVKEATVEYQKIFKEFQTGVVKKSEKHFAHLTFERLAEVEKEIRQVNPLGLTVTYIRDDAAFE